MERLNSITFNLQNKDSNKESTLKNFTQIHDAKSFPRAEHDLLQIYDIFSESEIKIRNLIRIFMEQEVAPIIHEYWEHAEFPHNLIPKISALNLPIYPFPDTINNTSSSNNNNNMSWLSYGLIASEIARVDCSMSTFFLVQIFLAAMTIEKLGSDSQKEKWLNDLITFKKIGCWALTEPDYGSDASSLQTMATRTQGGWYLNGQKRWIGNGTFADVFVIWARNAQTNQVNAFLVENGTIGMKTSKIENKISIRCVQNADIFLENVFVPDINRLPKVNSFADTNKVLKFSRAFLTWQLVGIVAGVFDMCLKYANERKQFKMPLSSFQLIQEKLVRIGGNLQAMMLLSWKLTKSLESGKMTHGQASLVKAWNSIRARESVSLGREILGGNGIITDFHVAKAFCDLEAVYSYEGTYEINVLIEGREITGNSAIKPIINK